MTFGFGFWLLLYLHIVAILSYFFRRCDLKKQTDRENRKTDRQKDRKAGSPYFSFHHWNVRYGRLFKFFSEKSRETFSMIVLYVVLVLLNVAQSVVSTFDVNDDDVDDFVTVSDALPSLKCPGGNLIKLFSFVTDDEAQ